MNQYKSATAAGIFGIILGGFGAHDWYLGRKRNALIHVGLMIAGLVVCIVGAVLMNTMAVSRNIYAALNTISLYRWIMIFGWILMMGSVIWGLVEGIIILAQGDEGLAARGHKVVGHNAGVDDQAGTSTMEQGAAQAGDQAASAAAIQGASATTEGTQKSSAVEAKAQVVSSAGVKAPRAPLSPVFKKKLFWGIGILSGVVVILIVVTVVLSVMLKIDYERTYDIIAELRPKVYTLHDDFDCDSVVEYVQATYVDSKAYTSYVNGCLAARVDTEDLVKELGETVGIQRDKDLSARYDKFVEKYEAVFPEQTELEKNLKMYQAWHKFVLLVDDLNGESTDAEFKTAADALKESGNDKISQYGEGWLAKSLAYAHAYQNYYAETTEEEDKETLRKEMNEKQNEQREWVAKNCPDITVLAPIETGDTRAMLSAFNAMSNLATKQYEEQK